MAFDPSIILAGKQYVGPDPNQTMRTLADLAQVRQGMGIQQAQEQRTLADFTRKQTQEAAMREIYQRNAGNPDAVGSELMRRGLGPEALEWMNKRADIGAREATADKSRNELRQAGIGILRNRAAAVKTPEQYATFIAPVPAKDRAELGLPDEYDAGALGAFVSGGIDPEKRADMEHRAEALKETKRAHDLMANRPSYAPIILGEGGAQFFAPPKPGAAATPITDVTGKPVIRPQPADTKLAERNVGGWTFNPKNPPSADAAKKFAGVIIAKDKTLAALDRMEALYRSTNPTAFLNPMSEAASQMEADWKEATDQIRIANEMGVPNGADYVMLAKQIPNPVGIEGARRTPAATLAKFRTLRTQVETNVAKTAKAYKYDPEQADAAAPQKGVPYQRPDGQWEVDE